MRTTVWCKLLYSPLIIVIKTPLSVIGSSIVPSLVAPSILRAVPLPGAIWLTYLQRHLRVRLDSDIIDLLCAWDWK